MAENILKGMGMKKNLLIAVLMTIVTTILLGIIYPLVITGLAQLFFKNKANGQLISKNGQVIGSRIIGQAFTGAAYFHSRPSFAGTGYDAANSNGSQLGPTNHALIDRVKADVATNQADHPAQPVPVDLVTGSGSGLDPDITPAAADFQIARVARERGASEAQIQKLIKQHTADRQFGFLGEPRVNVLELNLELDQRFPLAKQAEAR